MRVSSRWSPDASVVAPGPIGIGELALQPQEVGERASFASTWASAQIKAIRLKRRAGVASEEACDCVPDALADRVGLDQTCGKNYSFQYVFFLYIYIFIFV